MSGDFRRRGDAPSNHPGGSAQDGLDRWFEISARFKRAARGDRVHGTI